MIGDIFGFRYNSGFEFCMACLLMSLLFILLLILLPLWAPLAVVKILYPNGYKAEQKE